LAIDIVAGLIFPPPQAAAKGQVRHETLLFVHGWPDSWRSWQRVLPLLDSRFHVVAVDLLGFGESSKPDKASYSVTMFAENLHSFISGLGLDNVVLVGHGMGSFHAWVYAAKVL
jgi:pimeloyl-ACP methyl ester carboxylesterase